MFSFLRVRSAGLALVCAFVTLASPCTTRAEELPEVVEYLRSRKPLDDDQRDFLKKYIWRYIWRAPFRGWDLIENLNRGDTFRQLKKDRERLEILEKLRDRSGEPLESTALQFTNSYSDFAPVLPLHDGACYGTTELIRRLNLLAIYDPENRSGTAVPPRNQPAKLFAFFVNQLEKIGKNEPAVFPGYANLKELSSDPLLKRALIERAAIFWAEKNARFGALFEMLNSPNGNLTETELKRVHAQLTERLALRYNPVIFIAKPIKEWIHVLQVYAITERRSDGSYEISVWDPNSRYPYNKGTIRVTRAGATYGGTLTEIELVPGDDREIAEITGSLKRFCARNETLCEDNFKLPVR